MYSGFLHFIFLTIHYTKSGFRVTHMLQEDAELRIGLRVNGGLENGEEDVLQHFSKVWHKVPPSENVTERWGNRIRLS